MPEISSSVLLVAIQWFTFLHPCTCVRNQVPATTAQQVMPIRESKDTTAQQVMPIRESKESRNGIQAQRKKHVSRDIKIVGQPQFEEDREIPNLIGAAGLKQLRFDYLSIFTERGMQAFSGPGKDEFLADCMRDVMHWLGHNTKTTPLQRMEFCEKFWKTQNGGAADFADEIKHMEADGPCSDGSTQVDSEDRPCKEPPTSGTESERAFSSGGDHGHSSGGDHGQAGERGQGNEGVQPVDTIDSDHGYDNSDAAIAERIREINRAVPSEGSTAVHSGGRTDNGVVAVGDSDASGHWSHGESERTYPEARGSGGTESKANFRPIGWKSGTCRVMQPPLVVLVLAVANLHF
jgi:hypothetical protein